MICRIYIDKSTNINSVMEAMSDNFRNYKDYNEKVNERRRKDQLYN